MCFNLLTPKSEGKKIKSKKHKKKKDEWINELVCVMFKGMEFNLPLQKLTST